MKRFALKTLKFVAGIAILGFFFTPVHTATQLFICMASLLVAIICAVAFGGLDDKNSSQLPQ